MPPGRVDRWFRRLQLVSAAGFSLMHGANDAQKTMGIISGGLFSGRLLHHVPGAVLGGDGSLHGDWARHLAGGWRIIQTMGSKMTKLQPVGGFAAETGAAVAIFTATPLVPGQHDAHDHRRDRRRRIDTRLSAVRWGVAPASSGRGC